MCFDSRKKEIQLVLLLVKTHDSDLCFIVDLHRAMLKHNTPPHFVFRVVIRFLCGMEKS